VNATLKEQIVEKLDKVPDAQLPEVMDFLEFLTWKARQPQTPPPESTSTIDPLHALRGRGKGERLVERLLHSRQADRALDQQGREHVRP
jgi:hypothetical protein